MRSKQDYAMAAHTLRWFGATSSGATVFWTTSRLRAVRHGLWVPAILTVALAVAVVVSGSLGLDAHAYWAAWRNHLYSAVPQQHDAYLYSPAFAQVLWLLTLLPWPIFCAFWVGTVAGIYLWLLAPVELAWRIPLLLLCSHDIITGNVWSFFALVVVFGFRHPSLWSFPLLTKVTPAVGPIWFFARREWRSLAVALSVTAAVATVSLAIDPHLWSKWVRLLVHPGGFENPTRGTLRPMFYPSTAVSLAVRMPIALAITVWAARTNRRWLLAVAMVIAEPVFTSNALVILAAIPRIATSEQDAGADVSMAPGITRDGRGVARGSDLSLTRGI
jgi:hypothetical protein